MAKHFGIEETKKVSFLDIPHLKVTKKVKIAMSQPWIDFQDLRWQSDANGEDIGRPEINNVGFYVWRDTDVMVTLDIETMEIIDIGEVRE